MDDSRFGIFKREFFFCLVKTALFCLITALSNIILLIVWAAIFTKIRLGHTGAQIGFIVFAAVSVLVFFLIGCFLLAFDEKSPKDYIVPAMIFIAGTAAIIIFRENFVMLIMLSWNYILQWFISNMGGPGLLSVPVKIAAWLVCCGVMTAGIQFKRFVNRSKEKEKDEIL